LQSDLGGAPAIGLSTNGANLVRFNTGTPGTSTTVALGAIVAGETLVGIDFRPRTGPLCNFCAFKTWCPAYGGDPGLAAVEARLAAGLPAQLALPIPA
jgi:hypothetical protein